MIDIFHVSGRPILGAGLFEWLLLIIGITGMVYTKNSVWGLLTIFWLESFLLRGVLFVAEKMWRNKHETI